MDDETLRHTATHEAGHMVAFCRLAPGTPLEGHVTVEPSERKRTLLGEDLTVTLGGHYRVPADMRTGMWDVVACAGYGALVASGHPEALAADGCEGDFLQAEVAVYESKYPMCERGFDEPRWLGDLDDAKAAAIELMRRPENVEAVKRVADALVERRTLTCEEVADLIEGPRGHK